MQIYPCILQKIIYNVLVKRKILAELLEWKDSSERKPLILQGARQIGKTYIVSYFAGMAYKNSVYCNFEKEKKPSTPIFDDVRNDVDDWKVGDIVIHKKLGKGVVVALEGDDIIKVNFEEHGEKSILGTHPSVSKGGHEA